MDPIKIVIFLAAFALLLFIGRLLSRSSEIRGGMPLGTPSLPDPHSGQPVFHEPEPPDGQKTEPALTGKELGFPIKVPPLRRDGDGKYNRPNFLNYYFGKIDMVRGPADPSSFFDEFYLQAQDPASSHIWTYEYTVATPSGLQEVMNTERFASLYFESPVVIVPRWDLEMILHTVTEEILKHYGKDGSSEEVEKRAAEKDKLRSNLI